MPGDQLLPNLPPPLQLNHNLLPLPLHQLDSGKVQITKEASQPSLKCDNGESRLIPISPFLLLAKYLNIPSMLHLKELRSEKRRIWLNINKNFPLIHLVDGEMLAQSSSYHPYCTLNCLWGQGGSPRHFFLANGHFLTDIGFNRNMKKAGESMPKFCTLQPAKYCLF